MCLHEATLTPAELGELAGAAGLLEASIVVDSLDSKIGGASFEADRPLSPASMIKVPIAMALGERCRAGELALSQRTSIAEGNLTSNDLPSPFLPGGSATLEELARAMLAASDNTATNVLIDVLGREAITAHCRSLGLTQTFVRRKLSGSLPLIDDPRASGRNAHSASDAALLLRIVAERAQLGPNFVYAALAAQRWNEKLSAGFEPGDGFAHKTGDTDEVSHDGGILTLEDGRRYVVVVYTGLPSSPKVDRRFATFARALRRRLAP